jgi:hypothetical protein
MLMAVSRPRLGCCESAAVSHAGKVLQAQAFFAQPASRLPFFNEALASAYQLITQRPASFNIFGDGTRPAAVAQVPFLVFAAPFIIMRNALFGRVEPGNFVHAMISTIVAGFWSLMSGTVFLLLLRAIGGI